MSDVYSLSEGGLMSTIASAAECSLQDKSWFANYFKSV